jgi:hypothetical protein
LQPRWATPPNCRFMRPLAILAARVYFSWRRTAAPRPDGK